MISSFVMFFNIYIYISNTRFFTNQVTLKHNIFKCGRSAVLPREKLLNIAMKFYSMSS